MIQLLFLGGVVFLAVNPACLFWVAAFFAALLMATPIRRLARYAVTSFIIGFFGAEGVKDAGLFRGRWRRR